MILFFCTSFPNYRPYPLGLPVRSHYSFCNHYTNCTSAVGSLKVRYFNAISTVFRRFWSVEMAVKKCKSNGGGAKK